MAFEEIQKQEIELKKAATDPSMSADTYVPGKTVANKFEIISEIGKGGMSVVYKAKHLLLDKIVALKVLQDNRLEDPRDIQRFQNEARAASTLNHANIASVREFGLDNNAHPYIVMDYIEAVPLNQLIKDRSLTPTRALKIAAQICLGLEHAHAHGVIHRDIKPENILIKKNSDGSDQALIVDFGIARITLDDEKRTRLTQTGELFGTPSYMSPEQALGVPLDRRSDLYSLGCVLYEMLAGKAPFTADNPLTLLMKHMSEPAAPLSDIAAEIQSLVQRAMAKDPLQRYESAASFHASIESALNNKRTINMPEWSYARTLALRMLGWMIDLAIVSVPGFLIACYLPSGLSIAANRALSFCELCEQCMPSFGVTNVVNQNGDVLAILIASLICIANYFYHALMESSKKQATIGKQVVGLIVTNNSFGKLTFKEASYRHWSKIIFFGMYALIVGIALRSELVKNWPPVALCTMGVVVLISIILRKRYQMLHDVISSARVIPSNLGQNETKSKSESGNSFQAPALSSLCKLLVIIISFAAVYWGMAVNLLQMSIEAQKATLKQISESASRVSSPAEAETVWNWCQKARSESNNSTQSVAIALGEAGDRLVINGKLQDAERVYQVAARLSDAAKSTEAIIQAAKAYSFQCHQKVSLHDNVGGQQYGLRGLAMLSLLDQKTPAATSYDNLWYDSLVMTSWSLTDNKTYKESLQMLERAQNLSCVKNDMGRKSLLYLDIASVYLAQEKFQEALMIYQKAHDAAVESGDKYWQGMALAMEGNCRNGLNELDQAHELCQKAKKLMQEKPLCNYSWYVSYYNALAKKIFEENKVQS